MPHAEHLAWCMLHACAEWVADLPRRGSKFLSPSVPSLTSPHPHLAVPIASDATKPTCRSPSRPRPFPASLRLWSQLSDHSPLCDSPSYPTWEAGHPLPRQLWAHVSSSCPAPALVNSRLSHPRREEKGQLRAWALVVGLPPSPAQCWAPSARLLPLTPPCFCAGWSFVWIVLCPFASPRFFPCLLLL